MHVLVVHSDPRFYREIHTLLADQGISGAYQANLNNLGAQIEAHPPDLIVLEQSCLMNDGNQLGGAFRRGQCLPIVFLTAASADIIRAGHERNRLVGIISYLRSQTERARRTQVLQIGRLRIHAGRMRVSLGDQWVRLPPIHFRILYQLATNANELFPHRELMPAVLGHSGSAEAVRERLKVHIRQLRRKLGPGFNGYIQAVRGQGYVLVDPGAED